MSDGANLDRRAFFRALGRWFAAGGLTAGVSALAAKPGEQCINQGICVDCAAFKGCHLPQALSAKGHEAEEEKLSDCERRDE